MSAEIITKEDLQIFRKELLNDIKVLLDGRMETPNEWLKAQDVKKLLQISPGTLLSLRANGKLRFSKIGGTYYYRHRDIQNMLAKAEDGR